MLDVITEDEVTEEPKPFRVGDKVIPSEFDGHPNYVEDMHGLVGKVGVILEIEDSIARVATPDGMRGWYWPLSALTLESKTFKAGDRVVTEKFDSDDLDFVEEMNKLVGQVGVILRIEEDSTAKVLTPDGQDFWWWPLSALTHAPDRRKGDRRKAQ